MLLLKLQISVVVDFFHPFSNIDIQTATPPTPKSVRGSPNPWQPSWSKLTLSHLNTAGPPHWSPESTVSPNQSVLHPVARMLFVISKSDLLYFGDPTSASCSWNRIPSPSEDMKALEPLALPAPHLPSLLSPHSVCSSHMDVLLVPDHTKLSSRILCSTILSPWTSCYGSGPMSPPQGTFLTILLKVCPSLPGVFIILHFSDPFE